MFCGLPSPGEAQRKRVRREGEEQGNGTRDTREGVLREADFATSRGRTGFDGDVGAGIAGGCAYHP